MEQAGGQSIIHRKAQVARDGFDMREMSPAKALRLALARSGEALYGLALRVRTIEHQLLEPDAIEAAAGENALLILLDGAEGERGAVKLDLQFVAGLIEVQLMGTVRRSEAGTRPFTPTDAAISEPLMNALLEGADQDLTDAGLPMVAAGLRFGDRVADGRTLALALAAPGYDLYRLTVDMDRGAKTGVLELILPRRPAPSTGLDADAARALQVRLEQNALNAPVMLDAVLGGRMRVPLNRVCGWTAGTLLPLDPEALNAARLTGAKGHEVARVKLGQMNGFRAVQLRSATGTGQDIDPQGASARADRPMVDAGQDASPDDRGAAAVQPVEQGSPASGQEGRALATVDGFTNPESGPAR
jgi:flagellar motor switch protein FliM